MSAYADLIERLTDRSNAWNRQCDKWLAEAAAQGQGATPEQAAIMRYTMDREAADAISRLERENAELRGMLGDLQFAESDYRAVYGLHGDGSRQSGRAWDLMRRAGDKARALLSRTQEQRQ